MLFIGILGSLFHFHSFCVDVDCDGKHALVAEAYGRAILLELAPEGLADGARTETRFLLRDAESRYGARAVHAFGALFAGRNHDYVIFGAVGGRVLIWDRDSGSIQYEMDHGPGKLSVFVGLAHPHLLMPRRISGAGYRGKS